ncbi:MAG: DUF5106 domain-containing protein [Flavobacteriales bacterium]|nr:DUF5106 domain-containing protein [Flavobacteriales bacterium]
MLKKTGTLIIAVLLAHVGFSTPQADEKDGKSGHNITITVKGFQDTVCYLAGYFGKKQYYKDTAAFNANGVCNFSGDEPLPPGIYSLILPGNNYFEFIINEQEFQLFTDTGNLIQHMEVKNSLENKLFYEHFMLVASLQKDAANYKKTLNRLSEKEDKDSTKIVRAKLRTVNRKVEDYKLGIIKEHPTSFLAHLFKAMKDPEIPKPPKDENGKVIDSLFQYKYLKRNFWDNIDFSTDNILRTPIYHGRLMRFMDKMTAQIPDSIIVSVDQIVQLALQNDEMFMYTVSKLIYKYETSKIMCMDAVFVHIAEKYYLTGLATWVDDVQMEKIRQRVKDVKPTLCGKQAPPLYNLKDRDGKLIPLYSIDSEYTMMVFWDPDCGHCKKEMPKIKEVYDKYKAKGLQVYAVCTEQEKDKWLKYMDNHAYGWIDVADFELRSPFREYYNIDSTPKIFLLDRQKKVIAKKIAHEQLDKILARKLK